MYKKKNPKTPSDYETLRIRIPPGMEKEKLKIMKKVEAIRKRLNKTKAEDRKVYFFEEGSKNSEIIINYVNLNYQSPDLKVAIKSKFDTLLEEVENIKRAPQNLNP